MLGPARADRRRRSSRPAPSSTAGQWSVNLNLTSTGRHRRGTRWPRSSSTPSSASTSTARSSRRPITQPTQSSFTSFDGQVQISGSFTEDQAKALATELNYGALPVKLDQQTVQTVSPSLGKSSLQAGLISGLIGLLAWS